MKEIFSQLISPDPSIKEVHASTVLKIGDKLLCAFFGGTKEGKDDVKILLSVFENNRWSKPEIIASGDSEPCWNPVLFQCGDETLLFYKTGKKIPKWKTMLKTSSDGGKTWSEAKELVSGDLGGRGPVKNKPIMLSDGSICAPASIETADSWDCFTDVSRDNGKTWQKSGFVPFEHSTAEGLGIIQPTLWQDGETVYMLMRSSEGKIFKSQSSDFGKTWSPAQKTELPNNNSGIDCVRLNDGRIFVVYNPISENWGKRYIIGYSLSGDNAESFTDCEIIEQSENIFDEFSYPAVITDGKLIYLTYTHNRKDVMFKIFEI
ncbi:MAG: exo-alpha-sialidase [Acutalibacteraceae bacterium]